MFLCTVNFLIVAPFIEHRMSSAIVLKGGLDTGATFFGNSNFAFGVDVASKVALGNYTLNYRPWVYKPKNVVRFDDICFRAYIRGNDNSFFTKRSQYDPTNGDHTKSCFSFMIPKTETEFPRVIDLSGVYHISGVDPNNAELSDGKLPHFSSAPYYTGVWGFQQAAEAAALELGFLRRPNTQNTVAVQGAQIGPFDERRLNKGHLGPTFEGVAEIRNGQTKRLARRAYDTSNAGQGRLVAATSL